jgi:catalase
VGPNTRAAQPSRLVHNVIGRMLNGEPLSRLFAYWRNIDAQVGNKIGEGVRDRLA